MGSLPDTLTLNQHLDLCTVPELAEFLRFWGPHEKRRNGRADLVGKLQRLMSDENIVYSKVDLLSDKVRQVLLGLLRKTHYAADLSALFRGMSGLEMEHYEAEAALTALSKRGFVRVSRGNGQYERAAYAIPVEIALVMRGLAGVDSRSLDQVFLHREFRPSGVEAAAHEPPAEVPGDVHAAIDALAAAPLRKVAREVIEEYGGIITRHEFADRFHPRRVFWRSGQLLREFGRAGLGTVGHLDLRSKAIGVDDDALLIFSEAVEQYVEEWRARPLEHDRILTAHGDLMSDVRNVLDLTGRFAVRVAKEGAVYKAARGRIADQLQFGRQPLLDPIEIAERCLDITRGLGLAVANEERRLSVTEQGEQWILRPLLDKLRDTYGLLLHDTKTLRSHHLRGVQAILVGLLVSAGDSWWPAGSLAMVARNRYLLDLARDDAPPNRTPLTVLHHALTELGGAAHGLVVKDLFALGLVDVAWKDDEAVGVRLSRLGRSFFDDEPAPPRGKPLIVNPDFELLVLPEGDVDELLHELDRYAERTKSGEVVHYRLDKGRIERASVAGVTADMVLGLLQERARSELPQNVIYSVRTWARDVRSATLRHGVLFRTSDPAVVEAICSHPGLKEHVAEVVDARTVFFNPDVNEGDIAQELRALGVYLR